MDSRTPSSSSLTWLDRLRDRFAANGEPDHHHGDEPRRRWVAVSTCLLIALLLWFFLTMQETYTTTFELPTQVVGLPDDTALVSLPPRTVRVQVSGEGFQLLQLRLDPSLIPINASQEYVDLDQVAPELPKGIVLENVSPRIFNLEKERRIVRLVPIRLEGSLETAPTHDLVAPPALEPDSVFVSGARSIVNSLEAWPTAPLDVEGLQDSLLVRVPLSDTLAGLVELSEAETTVRAVAQPFTEATREIDVIVTGVPSSQKVVALDPSTVRVRYRVPLGQYDRALDAEDFFATVSYDTIRSDTTGRVRPEINVPSGIVLRNVEMIPGQLGYYEVLVDE